MYLTIHQIVILPPFQRTFVASNAVGLLLSYTLDVPPEGLGLRRSQWQTHAGNTASRRLATRMGYSLEGIQRFQRVIPANKPGNGFDFSRLPESTGIKLGQARDTAVFGHYCDEWAAKKGEVLRSMASR
jgi:RimJ/RimL family protein N-acetyltransferase